MLMQNEAQPLKVNYIDNANNVNIMVIHELDNMLIPT